MAGHVSVASLETLVGKGFEPHPSTVVGGCLFGVAHPPFDMVKVQKLPSLRFLPLKISIWNFVTNENRYFLINKQKYIDLFLAHIQVLNTIINIFDYLVSISRSDWFIELPWHFETYWVVAINTTWFL